MKLQLQTLLAFVLILSSAEAGEWMFRLRQAHVELRQALFDRNPDEAWEHVDRSTRQEAGILTQQIRDQYDALTDANKSALCEMLSLTDEQIHTLEGKDLLVAKCFLEMHPYLLVGDRDDDRLKDHGTRMAGPTGIIVHKKLPGERIVPYRFTTEGHFGGQAMDYRAQLQLPSLEAVLGPRRQRVELAPEVAAERAIATFHKMQAALTEVDYEAFWKLLDCDSQSQASHFADQAQYRARNEQHTERVLELLSLNEKELAALDGISVWGLAWSKEELAKYRNATNPRYVTADEYDKKLVPVPLGYKRRDRPNPESMIEFEAEGQKWQVPARVNYRNGRPEIKLFIRPPFYLRLRQ